jgi:hypothetical protein
MSTSVRSQRPERGSHLGGKELRLLPRREVAASVDFVEVDEVGVGLLGPAARRLILLAGKDATATGRETPLALKKPPLYSQ